MARRWAVSRQDPRPAAADCMIHPKKRVCRPAGRDDERPITNSSRSLLIAVSSIDRLSLVKGKKVEAPSKKGEALELVQLDLQKTSIAFVHPTESEAPFVFGTNTAVKPLRSPSAQAYRPNPLQSRVPPEIIDEIAIKLDLISFTHFAQTCARVRQACFGLQPVKTIISQMLQDWPTFLTPQEEKALSTLARRHTLVVPDSFREMIIEGPRTFIVDWLELPIFTDSEWKQIFISRFSAAAYQRAIAIKTVPWRTLYTRELSALEQLYAYGAGPRLNTSMTLPILFNEPEWCRNPVTMLWLNRDGTVEAQGNTHLNHANHVTPEELMQIERIAYHAGRRTFGPDSLEARCGPDMTIMVHFNFVSGTKPGKTQEVNTLATDFVRHLQLRKPLERAPLRGSYSIVGRCLITASIRAGVPMAIRQQVKPFYIDVDEARVLAMFPGKLPTGVKPAQGTGKE